jgi:hypothetical protein
MSIVLLILYVLTVMFEGYLRVGWKQRTQIELNYIILVYKCKNMYLQKSGFAYIQDPFSFHSTI